MPRIIAIGDIHGCLRALEALLGQVRPTPDDRLVFLGDYVDRGPDSRGVVEAILELRRSLPVVTLIGNHEEMMLSVLRGEAPAGWWLRYGGLETLQSYGFDGDLSVVPEAHVGFLESCVDWHAEEGCFFVHANYLADEPLELQPREITRWANLNSHTPGPHRSGRRAIVGHSSQKTGEVLDLGHLTCIDTFCHGGGWLTALEVQSGQRWQASREGVVRRQPVSR